MSSRTIVDIGSDMEAFNVLLAEAMDLTGGEITPEIEAIVDSWFAEITGDLNVKVDGYCALIRDRKLRAAAREEELERLQKLIRSDGALVQRLEWKLKTFMVAKQMKQIETRRYKVAVRTHQPGVVVNVNINDLPPEYVRVSPAPPPAPDKVAITRDLKAGLDKAIAVASFGEPKTTLEIS